MCFFTYKSFDSIIKKQFISWVIKLSVSLFLPATERFYAVMYQVSFWDNPTALGSHQQGEKMNLKIFSEALIEIKLNDKNGYIDKNGTEYWEEWIKEVTSLTQYGSKSAEYKVGKGMNVWE